MQFLSLTRHQSDLSHKSETSNTRLSAKNHSETMFGRLHNIFGLFHSSANPHYVLGFFFQFKPLCNIGSNIFPWIIRKSGHRCASLTCITWISCITCITCITCTTEIFHKLILRDIIDIAGILVPQISHRLLREISLT